jgi:hypothetical protein
MPTRNILCCLVATLVVLVHPMGAIVARASPLVSASDDGLKSAPVDATKIDAPPSEKPKDDTSAPRLGVPQLDAPREPDLASSVNGFLTAREWVSAMEVPDVADSNGSVPLPGVRGITAILRFEGRIIGSGEEWPGSVGDDRMLRRVVSRAIASALGHELIRGLDPAVRDRAGERLSLELDFAGRPEPLLGPTFDECAARIDKGLDGIALRRGYPGSISWHVAFPSIMIASNTARSPRATIERLVRESGLPAKDLPELGRIEPIGIFRFESVRLAQATPEAPPVPRGRGVARVIDSEVTRESVAAHAMGIVRRFIRALPPEEGTEGMPRGIGVFGNYSAVRDAYEPLVASPQDQALVAWAAAAVANSRAFTVDERAEARALALRVLRDLTQTTPTESQPLATVPSMAGVVCAMELLIEPEVDAGNPNLEPITDELLETAQLAREKLTERLVRGNNLNDRALASLAAAMTIATERRMVLAHELRKLLDSLWEVTDRSQLLSILPWLILADSEFSVATGEKLTHASDAYAAMKLLLVVQAGYAELAAEVDLRGGFRLSGERRAGVTSQSLRPGLALAGIVANPEFVPEEVPERQEALSNLRQRLIGLLRFSQELTVSGDLPQFFRNPRRVEGGVREALWDSDQTVPANALAVLVDVIALQAELWETQTPPPAAAHAESAAKQPSAAAE